MPIVLLVMVIILYSRYNFRCVYLIVRVRLDGLVGFEVALSRCIFGEKSDSDRFRTKSSPKVTFKGSFDGDDGPPGGGGELRPSSCCSSL